MAHTTYVIGLDYGTDSVRTVIVDASNGEEIVSHVHSYTRWKDGRYSDPSKNQFRQSPLDYLEGLEITIKKSLAQAPPGTAENIRGLSVDTTGSTPVAVDRNGTPLGLLPEFENNPHAQFILWKDHTAVAEAEEINQVARTWGGTDFTQYVGGVYSSEWFWAKILHVLREDRTVREAVFSCVEHCDWITAVLTGETDPLTIKRSRCAAGHKAMWHESYGGLPSRDFLVKIDPLLDTLLPGLYRKTYTSDVRAGGLSREWAEKLGLPEGIAIGVGAFDAHMGAVGGGIRPYHLSKVIGTSTCDMLVAPLEEIGDRLIGGICGQVDGSIIPGMLGMEAGQSAFGDVYAWFRDVLLWPTRHLDSGRSDADRDAFAETIIPALSKEAANLPLDETGIVAIDWLNGRRTPYADQNLKGAIMNLNLGSTAPAMFKALVEATAFGARKINDRFEDEGVPIKGVIALGGVAKKSTFAMQTLADILDRNIRVANSEQACALGAAMFAATAAGLYDRVEDALYNMESGFDIEYRPDPERAGRYRALYEKYSRMGTFIEQET